MRPGWVITHKGPAIYLKSTQDTLNAIAILNSECASSLLQTISPSLGFETGQVALLPWPSNNLNKRILDNTAQLIRFSFAFSSNDETAFDFSVPVHWARGISKWASAQAYIDILESEINDEVFALYSILPTDRADMEAELAGEQLSELDDSEEQEAEDSESDREITTPAISTSELAVRWISYALGIVLGRFQPGCIGSLGSAIYRCSDFAIGSLPAPNEAEFDELVGFSDTFAYIDPQGGRHVFSAQVEQALRALTISDGIAALDEGHPRDLVKLVTAALELLLGETQAREVIQTGAGGDLRKFLEKDFFTAWHFKWYRKRPVYWPIQSSKRSYGFVIFHEKITRETFYAIQREPYLDTKRNAVALRIADAQSTLGRVTGVNRKKLEKELDDLQKLADELTAFAKDLEAITLSGYEPEENWIDDGVILRMAPLWKVVPIWKSEPKKYWDRLENGDFDWSHLAMKYWPDRVRQKCKHNKSYAIAHGHEEWYQG